MIRKMQNNKSGRNVTNSPVLETPTDSPLINTIRPRVNEHSYIRTKLLTILIYQ